MTMRTSCSRPWSKIGSAACTRLAVTTRSTAAPAIVARRIRVTLPGDSRIRTAIVALREVELESPLERYVVAEPPRLGGEQLVDVAVDQDVAHEPHPPR